MAAFKVPNFRSAVMGFNKMDVTDFLARSESEMEILESRLAAADKTIDSMKSEIQNLTRRLETLTDENCRLESSNAQLRQQAYQYDDTKIEVGVHEKALAEIQTLQEKLAEAEEKANAAKAAQSEAEAARQQAEEARCAAEAAQKQAEAERESLRCSVQERTQEAEGVQTLQEECDSLRTSISTMEKERKAVQDALISAQRMGEIVLREAREQADQMVNQARNEAEDIMSQAQQRNDNLQHCYDRMMQDTSKMKSELIALYRRHLALLVEIPGEEDVPTLEAECLETVGE